MKHFIDKILKTDLTPNQYILLYLIMSGENKFLNFNSTLEKKALKSKGYITEDGALTNKCNLLEDRDPLDPFYQANRELEEKELRNKCGKLNQIFPTIMPSGRYGRSPSLKLIRDRIKAFLRIYPYDWETIFEAAKNYVERSREADNKYMKPLHNFILKDDEESTLALECEIIEEGRKSTSFSRTI